MRAETDHNEKDPLIRELEQLVCLVNTWGDYDAEHADSTNEWREGYEAACMDMLQLVITLIGGRHD